MLLVLFALALTAALRGWFPWSLVLFALPYVATIARSGLVAAATQRPWAGLLVDPGGPLDWFAAAALIAMVLRPRH